jgi:hypothetical protein
MKQESLISPPIAGAARSLDFAYPSPQIQSVGNLSVGIQWINRQSLTTWDMGTTTGFGVPPAGAGWQMYKGRVAHRQTGSGTSGGFYMTGGPFAIYFPQERQGGAFVDDFACWRIAATLAFDAGLGAGDTGLEIGPAINYDMVTGTPPGFRLGPSGPATIALQVRQNGGGALTVNQDVVAGIDTTDWHVYELRFIGATERNDAVLRALVDGVRVAAFNWGAGTLLPNWGNGASLGYMIGVGNRGATGTYIAQCGLQVAAASSEAGLL